MLLTIFQIIVSIYLCVGVLFAGLFAIALWRTGGFQGMADFMNSAAGRPNHYSSVYVQWLFVFVTLGWGLIPALFFFTRS